MDDKPKTIKDAALAVGVPIGTARQWVKDFQHTGAFSKQATPEKNRTRIFTDDDLVVLWTIKVKRAERKTTDEIADDLLAGDRFHRQEQPAPGQEHTTPQEQAESAGPLTFAESFDKALAIYESRMTAYDDRIQELTNELITAEKRAIQAETELRILREQSSKSSFWARLFNRNP